MRSAWWPWSCSPIGPAPTREPRIALPPDAMCVSLRYRGRGQAPEVNRVMRPSTTMHANHTRPRTTVMRFRLRSATPEAPRLEVTPPPNMSDSPPPRPRCSRISRVRSRLVIASTTSSTTSRISTPAPFSLPSQPKSSDGQYNGALAGPPGARAGAGDRRPFPALAATPAAGLRSHVLREPRDRGELGGVQARAAHQRPVDVRLPEEAGDVPALHGAAVEDAGAFRRVGVESVHQGGAESGAHLLRRL